MPHQVVERPVPVDPDLFSTSRIVKIPSSFDTLKEKLPLLF